MQTAITGVTVPSAADYTSSSGSFGVGAVSGATSTLTITAVDDQLVEGPESFPGVTLSAPTSTASVSTAGSGTVNITDNDTATVSVAGTLNGSETGPASATFTVTQSAASSTDTVVAFTLGGTATEGSDYTAITHSVTIPANTTTATITIPVINDAMVESTETVTVTLVSPITSGNAGISVDTTTASRTITDNDSATVSVAGTLNGSETGPTSTTFTVTQSADQFHRYGGGLHLGGTATEGSDYTAIPHSVTIPANTTTATITIPVINDALVEPTETVTVTLVSPITSGNAGISVDTTTASRTIADNDTTTVSVAGTLNGSETGPGERHLHGHAKRHQFHRYGGGLHAGGHRHRRCRLHRHHAFRHDSRQHHHGYHHDPRDQRRPGRTN